ncbi:MAG: hypothetical protein J0L62_06445 [Bacteroidetes bacterium]|nr:hypothetical protein [Bacteroidota bacterium]
MTLTVKKLLFAILIFFILIPVSFSFGTGGFHLLIIEYEVLGWVSLSLAGLLIQVLRKQLTKSELRFIVILLALIPFMMIFSEKGVFFVFLSENVGICVFYWALALFAGFCLMGRMEEGDFLTTEITEHAERGKGKVEW